MMSVKTFVENVIISIYMYRIRFPQWYTSVSDKTTFSHMHFLLWCPQVVIAVEHAVHEFKTDNLSHLVVLEFVFVLPKSSLSFCGGAI